MTRIRRVDKRRLDEEAARSGVSRVHIVGVAVDLYLKAKEAGQLPPIVPTLEQAAKAGHATA